MTTVLVSGALANKPGNGGEAWVRLGWVRGLQRLGVNAYLVEQIGRETCIDAEGTIASFEESINLAYFRKSTTAFGLGDSAALIYEDGEQVYGMTYAEVEALADSADLLINISGHLSHGPLLDRVKRKAYVDIDPGFTQFWHADEGTPFRLDGHDVYFTIGENIGTDRCMIPTDGISWRATRQPVVLDDWPVEASASFTGFTTVANWRGPYGPVVHKGQTFGLKVHEFRRFIDLPAQAAQPFELALNIHPADHKDLRALQQAGWKIENPEAVASDPLAFRRYVQRSGAEFSVAQGIYVDTNSGWFSDRSVRYLASGKPVLVQDTGFSHHYPTGKGLLTFRTLDEAAEGAQEIARNYEAHCRAARALAETYFNATTVLNQFLTDAGL